jgi:acid phosphatase
MFQRGFSILALASAILFSSCGGGNGNGFQFNGNGGNGTGSSSNGSNGSGNNGSGSGGSTGNSIQHVVIVVFENQNYSDVVGSSSMPYWNSLASAGSLATQFYADVHPSIGNYLIMTAGQDPTLGSSDPDNWSGTITDENVASVLTAAGKTWKVYAQSLPSTGYTGGDQYPYVKHHNPFAYFDSVRSDPKQSANIVDLSQFTSEVSTGSLPNYSFVVPDDQHNGHDCPSGNSGCPLSDRLSAIDDFLKNDIGPLLDNSALMANTVVVITFDESATDATNGGGHIPVIVAGGPVKAGFQSNTTYQLQSLLRFSLQSLGQSTYPGMSKVAAPMTEFLK